jgi:hypothetical protein
MTQRLLRRIALYSYIRRHKGMGYLPIVFKLVGEPLVWYHSILGRSLGPLRFSNPLRHLRSQNQSIKYILYQIIYQLPLPARRIFSRLRSSCSGQNLSLRTYVASWLVQPKVLNRQTLELLSTQRG